jgi:hypothetical protein
VTNDGNAPDPAGTPVSVELPPDAVRVLPVGEAAPAPDGSAPDASASPLRIGR